MELTNPKSQCSLVPACFCRKMSGQKYDPIQTGLGPYGLIFASSLLEVQQRIVAAIHIKVVLFHSAFWPWNFRYTFILTTIYILYGFHIKYISIHPQSTCTVPKWIIIKRLTVGVSFNKNWRHSSQDPHPWPTFAVLRLGTRIIIYVDPHISHREGLAVSRCWDVDGKRGAKRCRDVNRLGCLFPLPETLQNPAIPGSWEAESSPTGHHRSQSTCSRSASAEDSVVSGTVLGRTILLDWRGGLMTPGQLGS